MPGFLPGIRVFAKTSCVDGRDKPAHDQKQEAGETP
jgi:hypothetical protein